MRARSGALSPRVALLGSGAGPGTPYFPRRLPWGTGLKPCLLPLLLRSKGKTLLQRGAFLRSEAGSGVRCFPRRLPGGTGHKPRRLLLLLRPRDEELRVGAFLRSEARSGVRCFPRRLPWGTGHKPLLLLRPRGEALLRGVHRRQRGLRYRLLPPTRCAQQYLRPRRGRLGRPSHRLSTSPAAPR